MTHVKSVLVLNALVLVLGLLGMANGAPADEPQVVEIGTRRELFVDDFLIDRRDGLELRLQAPVPREIVLEHDAPWEGSGCGYHTIFRDGEVVRMYYIAADLTNADGTEDGVAAAVRLLRREPGRHPLGQARAGAVRVRRLEEEQHRLVRRRGSTTSRRSRTRTPPAARTSGTRRWPPGPGGLFAYKSADGIHWSPLADKPIITKGAFDTQNNAFWDPVRKQYWCYIRDFHDGIRDIRVATSTDFRTWTEPELLAFVDSPDEPLYTNQVRPYDRAPHLFLGFPTRYIERRWSPTFEALPDPAHRRRG